MIEDSATYKTTFLSELLLSLDFLTSGWDAGLNRSLGLVSGSSVTSVKNGIKGVIYFV